MNSAADDFGIYLFPVRTAISSLPATAKAAKAMMKHLHICQWDRTCVLLNYALQGIVYTYKKTAHWNSEWYAPWRCLITARNMQDFTTGNDGKFLFRVYENEL